MKNLLFNSILVLICFSSCSKKDDTKPHELDYYPTSKSSQWEYTWSNGGKNTTQVLGDTIVEGKQYAMIGPVGISYPFLVRKEKGRYYSRINLYGNYRAEIIFLQDNLPVGGSWINEEPEGKQVNTIISIDNKRIIAGKEYTNTIEVKREYFDKYTNQLSFTQWNIYAKGIGQVVWSLDQNQELTLTEYDIK